MPSLHFFIFAGLSMAIAITSALLRSNVILILASFNMATSASILLLATIATLNKTSEAIFHGLVLIFLSTTINLVFCAVVVMIYRSRGTLRLDDYRELRG